ncbi:MAG: hypothetical protein ACLFVK_01450 [Dehalococcoidia bacterium]
MWRKTLLYTVTICVLLLVLNSQSVFACEITEGNDDIHKWTGAKENVASIQGVKADLGTYNPSPVFQTTSFWVMLTQNEQDPDRWAQVGWYKAEDNSNIYVWCEFTDDSGQVNDYFYYEPGDYWTGVPSTTPTSSETYQVTYSADSPGTFYMRYANGASNSASYMWEPSRLEVQGETLNYADPDKGDHVVGDVSNKVHASSIKKKLNGTWQDASPNYSAEGHGAYDNNTTMPGFRIWDTRQCEK